MVSKTTSVYFIFQVRPIRSKTCLVSGGGVCTSVALNIAAAARKRGWRGPGGGGGAVTVAEAIAERMRRQGLGKGQEGNGARRQGEVVASDITVTVAPNGFINCPADAVEALFSAAVVS